MPSACAEAFFIASTIHTLFQKGLNYIEENTCTFNESDCDCFRIYCVW